MFKEGLLKGKRILVTGGGTGLGKEMATHYASLGADIVICGRRLNVLEETADEIKSNHNVDVLAQSLDIRSPQDVDDFIDQIFATKPLDGLVNNAAGNFISPTKMLSPRGFDAIAWTGSPYVVPSAMSKSAINAMTKSLAVEWGPYNIRVNAIAPGPFPTEGAWARLSPKGDLDNDSSYSAIPLGRVGEMSELQNLASFLMADGCDYLTGQTIAIDGAQYITGGGTFSGLSKLKDSDWEEIKSMIKSTNEKDKANRNT